jgi:hypothetical protein
MKPINRITGTMIHGRYFMTGLPGLDSRFISIARLRGIAKRNHDAVPGTG